MHIFVYPAVFYKDDDKYTVVFPDLDIFTDGDNIEEAYLFAKDYLRCFCTYALKYEIEVPEPSSYEEIVEKNKDKVVMLVDVFIKENEIK